MNDLATGESPVGLTVKTTRIDDITPLLTLVDPRQPLAFVRRNDGIAGVGTALRLEFRGETRMSDAARAWREIAAAAQVDDEVTVAGSGLVAFGSFAFAAESQEASVLIVPRLVLGHRDGVHWITRIGTVDDVAAESVDPVLLGAEYHVPMAPGAFGPAEYAAAVAGAVEAIERGEVSKVVLARTLEGTLPLGADVRVLAADLASGYPDTYTFAVEGLIGSSPETLIRSEKGELTARVLAGSKARGTDALSDSAAAAELATSPKDLDEHAFALQSLLQTFARHATHVVTAETPFTLKLPNVWHLATDVRGRLADGASSLDLIDTLHPTAAVAGTPTTEALAAIARLEPFDRGRYAGPVGWVGADGDGEWAIALRCAQVSYPEGGGPATVTAFAGAGIVRESVPEAEVAETTMKFRPIVDALGRGIPDEPGRPLPSRPAWASPAG
ncbi:isochorismate synthase MenF [Frondihabitans sp. PAMC 28766]|uniref:isochorismate synthase n=1 Tax=Frondihabitans sp. PAMC 28766 TaxID=1795630 RepID=UPI001EF4BE18|nr:isochorismate synthase [Frondihabitans sp. PAMC 28766]